MNPVLIAMLVWAGAIALLIVVAWVRHRVEQRHTAALEYQRLMVSATNGDPYPHPLPNLASVEHDYQASLEASRARRGK